MFSNLLALGKQRSQANHKRSHQIAARKTVVLLTDLQPESTRQLAFWDAKAQDQEKAGQLMKTLDHINAPQV